MRKKILKFITCILTILVFITTPLNVKASEKNQYFGVILYDNSSYKLAFTVYQDDGGKLKAVEKYSSADVKYFPFKETDFNDKYVIDKSSSVEHGDKSLTKTYLAFPGINTEDNFTVYTTDFDQANAVIGGLIGSLNSAIGYAGRYGMKDGTILISTSVTLKEVATDIAKAVDDSRVTGDGILTNATNIHFFSYEKAKEYAASKGETGVKFSSAVAEIDKIVGHAEGTYRQGITVDDFVVMMDLKKAGPVTPLMVSCPKGYATGQLYYGERGESYTIGQDRISWKGIVTYANSAAGEGLWSDTDGWAEFVSMGSFEKHISEFASSITSKGAKALGLNTLEELVFNREGRGSTYYLGMMPYTWFQVSNSLFWVFQIIAIFILFASVLYAVYKQNYAVISPSERLSLQDHIANILIAIVLMVLYVPIFYILGKSNQMIVQLFDSMTSARTLASSFNLGWLVSLVVTILNLVILVKLNVTYLVRAATITLLHIISPAAIASMAIMGNKRGSLFNTWLRELINAIFIQSFDSIVLALFIMVNSYGGTQSAWEGLMLMFMFIPLNNWFKEKITGTSGITGVSKDIQGQASNRVAAAVTGIGTIAGIAGKASQAEKDADSKNLVRPEGSANSLPGGKRTNSSTTSGSNVGGSGNVMKEEALVSQEGNMKADKSWNKVKNATKTAGAVGGVLLGATVGGSVGNAISGVAGKNYSPSAFRTDKYEEAYTAVENQGQLYDGMMANYDEECNKAGLEYDQEEKARTESIERAEKDYDKYDLIKEEEEARFIQDEQRRSFASMDEDAQQRTLEKDYYNLYKSRGEDDSEARLSASVLAQSDMDNLNKYKKGSKEYRQQISNINDSRLESKQEIAQNKFKNSHADMFSNGERIDKQQYVDSKTYNSEALNGTREQYIDSKVSVPDALINKKTNKQYSRNEFIHATVKDEAIKMHDKYVNTMQSNNKETN